MVVVVRIRRRTTTVAQKPFGAVAGDRPDRPFAAAAAASERESHISYRAPSSPFLVYLSRRRSSGAATLRRLRLITLCHAETFKFDTSL